MADSENEHPQNEASEKKGMDRRKFLTMAGKGVIRAAELGGAGSMAYGFGKLGPINDTLEALDRKGFDLSPEDKELQRKMADNALDAVTTINRGNLALSVGVLADATPATVRGVKSGARAVKRQIDKWTDQDSITRKGRDGTDKNGSSGPER